MVGLRLEAFYVELDATGAAAARAAVEAAMGGDAQVSAPMRDPEDPGRFGVEVAPPGAMRDASVGEAWAQAHALAGRLSEGATAEPLFAGEHDLGRDDGTEALEGAEPDGDWHLDVVGARAAWGRFAAGVSPGVGVIIGHPDTGYSDHSELGDAATRQAALDRGVNLVEEGQPPIDPRRDGVGRFPGHGTATGSILVSPQQAGSQGKEVHGIAPGAALLPIRVANTVVTFGWTSRLARAIETATDQGCHVVSMSLGGFGSRRLRRAVRHARKHGVIVVAASGNYVQVVAWPAAYDETIACAACGPNLRPWAHSSKGPAVDITAPGHRVKVAGWKDGDEVARYTSGTSYAATIVAGTAALWLSLHGVEKLRGDYPGRLLPLAFKRLLQRTATPADSGPFPRRWFGAGLAQIDGVLGAALPKREELEAATESFASLGDALDHVLALPAGGAESLGGAGRWGELPGGLRDELAFHLALDPSLRATFADRARAAEAPAAAKRAASMSPALSAALEELAPAGTSSVGAPRMSSTAVRSEAGEVTAEVPLRITVSLGAARIVDPDER